MDYKNIKLSWLGHASFKIIDNVTIYIDPYDLSVQNRDADIILITHEHYDHFSLNDIKKIAKDDTIIVLPKSCTKAITQLTPYYKIISLDPYESKQIILNHKTLNIKAYPAYNLLKQYHPKINHWLGYFIDIDGIKIYHCGDSDLIDEYSKLTKENIDILLIPIGGTYTMDAEQAAEAVKIIKPKITIPMHYGIIGTKEDAQKFHALLKDSGIEIRIL